MWAFIAGMVVFGLILIVKGISQASQDQEDVEPVRQTANNFLDEVIKDFERNGPIYDAPRMRRSMLRELEAEFHRLERSYGAKNWSLTDKAKLMREQAVALQEHTENTQNVSAAVGGVVMAGFLNARADVLERAAAKSTRSVVPVYTVEEMEIIHRRRAALGNSKSHKGPNTN